METRNPTKTAVVLAFVVAACVVRAGEPVPSQPDPLVVGQVIDNNGAGVADVLVQLLPDDPNAGAEPVATARTDGYGDFELPNAESARGSFVVVFTKPGYAESRRPVELIPGDPPPFVDIVMAGGMTIRGTVTHRDGAQPIAGAQIRLSAAGRDWTVESGANGTFTIESVPPGRGELSVDAPGLGRARRRIENLEAEPEVTFELAPERRCRIVAVDWRGNPVAGVEVSCIDDVLGDRWFVRTGDDGSALIRNLPGDATALKVMLTHEDFVSDTSYVRELPLDVDAVESEHRLNLLSAGGVRGTITGAADEKPMNGVRITVGPDMGPAWPRAWSDFDGRYEVAGVAPGDVVVTAYVRGHAPQLAVVRVTPDEFTVSDFRLEQSREASGIVVDGDGKGIPGAYLFATSWRGHQTLGVHALTDEDGKFELDSLPADVFDISIDADGFDTLVDQQVKPGRQDHRFTMIRRVETPLVRLNPGDVFPALELATLTDGLVKIADLRGKVVLIDFWATWCGPCVAEIPDMVRVYEALGERSDFAMINISLDDPASADQFRVFIEKRKMKWPQVFGEKSGAKAAATACGVRGIPAKFLIAPDGKLAALNPPTQTIVDRVRKLLEEKPPTAQERTEEEDPVDENR